MSFQLSGAEFYIGVLSPNSYFTFESQLSFCERNKKTDFLSSRRAANGTGDLFKHRSEIYEEKSSASKWMNAKSRTVYPAVLRRKRMHEMEPNAAFILNLIRVSSSEMVHKLDAPDTRGRS